MNTGSIIFEKEKIKEEAIKRAFNVSRLHKKGIITKKELQVIITAIFIKYENMIEDFEIYYDNKMQEAKEIEREMFETREI